MSELVPEKRKQVVGVSSYLLRDEMFRERCTRGSIFHISILNFAKICSQVSFGSAAEAARDEVVARALEKLQGAREMALLAKR